MHEVKRVLHIEIKGGIGGIETFLLNVYRNINRDGIQFDFVSSDENVLIEEEINLLGGKVYHIPYTKYFELYKLIKEKQYSIVHIHKNSAANIVPVYICCFAGVKNIVIHSHNTLPSKGKVSKLMHYVNRPLLRMLSTKQYACSTIAAEWLFGKRYMNKKKVTIINNGIDISKFKYNEEKRLEIRDKYELAQNTFVLGTIGRIVPQKNQIFLLKLLKELKGKIDNVKLIICGDGPLKEELIDFCKENDLINYVIFTGKVLNANEMLQAFDVFLVPSLYEGLCISAVEAQCAGLPTIVSDKLPSETELTSSYVKLSIDEGTKKWVDECLKFRIYKRKDESSNIENKGYSIKRTAKILQENYMMMKDE